VFVSNCQGASFGARICERKTYYQGELGPLNGEIGGNKKKASSCPWILLSYALTNK
jgi:hypothetical protein